MFRVSQKFKVLFYERKSMHFRNYKKITGKVQTAEVGKSRFLKVI